jgi:hypothetical protein
LLAFLSEVGFEGKGEAAFILDDLVDDQPPWLELVGVALLAIPPLRVEAFDVLDEVLSMERVVGGKGLNIAGVDALYVLIGMLYSRIRHKFSFYEVEDETFLDQS